MFTPHPFHVHPENGEYNPLVHVPRAHAVLGVWSSQACSPRRTPTMHGPHVHSALVYPFFRFQQGVAWAPESWASSPGLWPVAVRRCCYCFGYCLDGGLSNPCCMLFLFIPIQSRVPSYAPYLMYLGLWSCDVLRMPLNVVCLIWPYDYDPLDRLLWSLYMCPETYIRMCSAGIKFSLDIVLKSLPLTWTGPTNVYHV